MDYETACRMLGYTEAFSVSEPTRRWLVSQVEAVITAEGPEALDGPEGDMIRAIFDGRFPPEPLRPSERRP